MPSPQGTTFAAPTSPRSGSASSGSAHRVLPSQPLPEWLLYSPTNACSTPSSPLVPTSSNLTRLLSTFPFLFCSYLFPPTPQTVLKSQAFWGSESLRNDPQSPAVLPVAPTSCTASQVSHPTYLRWCGRLGGLAGLGLQNLAQTPSPVQLPSLIN